MNKHNIYLILSLLLFTPALVVAADAADVLKQANETLQQAKALQGGWTSTQELIDQAQAALSKGDQATATTLANKAKREAVLSLQQAQAQTKDWSEPSYLR